MIYRKMMYNNEQMILIYCNIYLRVREEIIQDMTETDKLKNEKAWDKKI